MRGYHLASQNSIHKSLSYASSIILGESYDKTRSIDILNISDSKAISRDYAAVYKNYSISFAKISRSRKKNTSKRNNNEKRDEQAK